jgi:hypothetical protein
MSGYETAVVRLTTPDGKTAGLGVLVGPRTVVTCAHVLNTALGRDQREQARPDWAAEIPIRFPFIEGSVLRSSRVAAWVPPPIDGAGSGDVAGLLLGESAPPKAVPARFASGPRTPNGGLRVFGYPGDPPRKNGAWVDLDLKGVVSQQLIQVESRGDQTIKAQPGYSGSPVWSSKGGLVIGLLQATAFVDESARDAYLIPPATVLQACQDHLLIDEETTRFSVAPPVLSFGKVGPWVRVEGRVEVHTMGDEDFRMGLDPPRAFLVERFSDGIAVSPRDDLTGEHRATLAITSGPRCKEVELGAAIAAEPDDVLPEWPLRGEEDTRPILQEWARKHRLVPSDLFDGQLHVTYQPVVRASVTHVRESRTSEKHSFPKPPDRSQTYSGSIEDVRVNFPPWAEGNWAGALKGSVVSAMCQACDNDHRVFCRSCRGSTKLSCPTDELCPLCSGTKTVRRGEERARCPDCSGRGRLTCRICGGSGIRQCDQCADGKVPCPQCGGNGETFVCEWGEVRRSVSVGRTQTDWSHAEFQLEESDFVQLAVAGSTCLDLIPSDKRAELSEWLEMELAIWQPKEMLRRVQLSVAPVTVTSYKPGRREFRALVVGTRVEAPGAKWLRLWLFLERLLDHVRGPSAP